jgi:ABC-2 type transport system permease protein
MRHIPTLFKRELSAYFLGPMAFLILLAFQAIAGINFLDVIESLAKNPRVYSGMHDPLNRYLSASPSFWIALLVALPALTMRLLAEEKRSGTIETLLTVPVTETEVVFAKWLAGLFMYLGLLLPFAVYLPFLYYQGKFHFDPGPFLALAIGMTTLGMMFVAIGLFFSALTRNQIVAAIWTFVLMFAFIFLTNIAHNDAQLRQSQWAEVIQFTSVLWQVYHFGLGQLDLRFVTLHLSVCAFMLFLTIKVVQWRREA